MIFPVNIKLAAYEAEVFRMYMRRMLESSLDKNARNEVIILGEYYPRLEANVRSKRFRFGNKVCTYILPLSVARIIWYRWQLEDNGQIIQSILGKIDHAFNAINRVPNFSKILI